MSAGFLVASLVQIALGVAVPLLFARVLASRTRARWGSFGLGALVFALSQVVHLPLNSALDWALTARVAALGPAWGLVASALILGLSAGVCEEGARYAFFKVAERRRGRDEGLMVGLGHGGIESILFGGVLVLWSIAQLAALERVGPEALGVSAEDAATVAAQLAAIGEMAWWMPLAGAAERLMVLPFHVAATMIVLYGVVTRRWWCLPAAILWHALLDGVAVWVMGTFSALHSELWLLLTLPVSVTLIWRIHRALPKDEPAPVDPGIAAAAPSGAPVELFRATKRYDTVTALEEATLVLETGARTCLLGPNGAGKTTAIRLALGALAPTAGRVWLFGAEHESPGLVAGKRRTGVVPQQPGMYEDLTVRQHLELVRALYGRGDIEATAAELGVTAMLDRPMAKHSGGQQRRIALAAALLSEPDLLVLDEPSAGLDPIAQKTMRETLRRVGVGRTVLLCTHDLDEAEALSERVVILEKGHVKVHERIDVLRAQHPAHVRVRATQHPSDVARAIEAAGVPGAIASERGARAPLVGGRSRVPALLRALLAAGIDVEECVVEEASLEEIFLAAVEASTRRASLPPAARADAAPRTAGEHTPGAERGAGPSAGGVA